MTTNPQAGARAPHTHPHAAPPTPDSIEADVRAHLRYTLGKTLDFATIDDLYMALARTVRDLSMDGMLETGARYITQDVKTVYYLSMEFLIGRSLGNNLLNLGVYDLCRDAIARLGYDLEEVREVEMDAALGNGGLGRLAACFLDSMATLGIPGYGYGINYEFGLFRQAIEQGYQVEHPEQWLANGSPWQIERNDQKAIVPLRGRVTEDGDAATGFHPAWVETQSLVGVPYDMPVVGWRGRTVNRLRLYSARASDEFDIRIFNEGHYAQAVRQKISSESVSKILYPRDTSQAGQELRLTQEYFLVACAMSDIIRRYKMTHASMDRFSDKVAIQLNDTHPTLAIAELMRVLIDEESVTWDTAWRTTVATFGYTNHTLLPEALEKWPVSLVEYLLPRHMQIIYEINRRFLEFAAPQVGHDAATLSRLSLVEEGAERKVRMAALATVGSHAVNGVAEIHSTLLRETVLRDYATLWPQKFTNVTNGITPRRWLLKANPTLSAAITARIGEGWVDQLDHLRALVPHATDPVLLREVAAIKLANKQRLATVIAEQTGILVDPTSIFDLHAKRFHEYKRQLLNALHIVHLYLTILDDPAAQRIPRTFIFAGKAAPGYFMAKLIIKCITAIGTVVNADPRARDLLRVVFLPDYRVSLAERIIPAADVSEQISTAGKEASGTGNMKFALNGALTVGTLDGANVEMLRAIGPQNMYIFGLTVDQIQRMRADNRYDVAAYAAQPAVRRVIDALSTNLFCRDEPGLLTPLLDALLNRGDEYCLLADFNPYAQTHARIAHDYTDTEDWTRRAILNIAAMGHFSSDRAITEYATRVWHVEPVLRAEWR